MERNAEHGFDVHIHGEQLRKIGKPVKWSRRRVLRLLQHFYQGPDPFFRENTAGPEDHEPQVVMKDSVGWQFQFHASKDVTGGEDVFAQMRSLWNRTLVQPEAG